MLIQACPGKVERLMHTRDSCLWTLPVRIHLLLDQLAEVAAETAMSEFSALKVML